MRIANIEDVSLSNGPGVRTCLYIQGCPFHCKGCFNPETWDFNGGLTWNKEVKEKLWKYLNHDYIAGLSILGGEPLDIGNIEEISKLTVKFKRDFPNKNIWIWTGNRLEDMERFFTNGKRDLLTFLEPIDFIVDGLFVENLKDPSLKWRGSSNQRIIDIKEFIRNDGNIS